MILVSQVGMWYLVNYHNDSKRVSPKNITFLWLGVTINLQSTPKKNNSLPFCCPLWVDTCHLVSRYLLSIWISSSMLWHANRCKEYISKCLANTCNFHILSIDHLMTNYKSLKLLFKHSWNKHWNDSLGWIIIDELW